MINSIDFSSLKQIRNRENHRCFGCSPVNTHGLRMRFYTDEKSVYSKLEVPEHLCGWNNLVHGGVLSTILDEIMSWSVIYLLKRFILTKSISVDFLKPVYIQKEIIAEGSIIERVNDREVTASGRLYFNGGLAARSTGRIALLTMESMKSIGLADEEMLRDFDAVFNS